jgi:urease accessory protein
MLVAERVESAWRARLDLAYERRAGTTVVARREHVGPLRVQKALYPEGPAVCHGIVLHPPAGVAGGDELDIAVGVGPEAHALLTTPGAGKWYRSAGPWARQNLDFQLAAGAILEWLPQETIIFDAARAQMNLRVQLAEGALFIGQEVICLGRRASGESFINGSLRLATDIRYENEPLWRERGRVEGASPLLASPVGLDGFSVCGTLLVAGKEISTGLLADCREAVVSESDARFGVTALPRLLVARYLGRSAEAARSMFVQLWNRLRPALLGREAQTPRIWNT